MPADAASQARVCPICGASYDDPIFEMCPDDGAFLSTPDGSDPLMGRTLGDYEVTARLGHGAMAAVYVARPKDGGRDVALKVLKPELARDSRVQLRFAREARLADLLRNDRIVSVLEYGRTDEGLLFIAMELLEGMSIAELLSIDGRLPASEAVRVALEIARALKVAHDASVVHRDLKPDNVFVTARNGSVKVLDFGIAKILAEDVTGVQTPAMTQIGAILGTPAYMSPESAAGRTTTIGPPADVYALGVMLFEMLCGRRPFEEKEPILLLGMHVSAAPPPLRSVAPQLPCAEDLETLLLSMMEKDPPARPGAAAVIARLEVIAAQIAVHEEVSLESQAPSKSEAPAPSTQITGAMKRPRRKSLLPYVILAGCVVGALLAAGVITLALVLRSMLRDPADEPTEPASAPAEATAAPEPASPTAPAPEPSTASGATAPEPTVEPGDERAAPESPVEPTTAREATADDAEEGGAARPRTRRTTTARDPPPSRLPSSIQHRGGRLQRASE